MASFGSRVKLYSNSKDRQRITDLADLYSIIKACEALEAAYTRDAVSPDEYESACKNLISQFKTTESALVSCGLITDVDSFMREYGVDTPRARNRLLLSGVPATVLHASHHDGNISVIVAETTQAFITVLDALKLEQRAVDELQPLLSDLMASLTKVPGLNVASFDGAAKIQEWLTRMNQLRAVDNISEDDARQCIFDIDHSYAAFHAFLKA